MLPGLTERERHLVMNDAIRLIERPENFVQGDWKCPVYEVPKMEGQPAHREGLSSEALNQIWGWDSDLPVQATDAQGRPLFAYCAEGAINQAGINILGLDRAQELGAWAGEERYGEAMPAETSTFSEYLSINELARVMYADFLTVKIGSVEPMRCPNPLPLLNDAGSADGIEIEPGAKEDARESILNLFRKYVQNVRAEKGI